MDRARYKWSYGWFPILPAFPLSDARVGLNEIRIPKQVNKNKSKVDTKQSAQIAQLSRAVAALGKKRKSTKRSRKTSIPRSPHPLLPQVQALVSPFECTPGSGKHLVDPMPSQAYKLKSRATITVGNAHTMVGLISPAFGDLGTPGNFPSAIFYSAFGSQNALTVLEDGTAVGTSPVKGTGNYSAIAPIRPYPGENRGSMFRLVSYGVRVRYTGTALNANGTLKFLPNDLAAMPFTETTTFASISNYVDGNNHTIMRSIYDKAVYDFNGLGATEWMNFDETFPAVHDEGRAWGETATQPPALSNWSARAIGQNSSPVQIGQPGMILTYTNNTTANVQFEIELVENWEVRTPTNTAFQTDSHGNPELSQEVFRTVVSGHMHAAASSVPNVTKSLKAVNAASKSPLGKLVIAAALS